MEEHVAANTPPLKPHSYPLWVKLFGASIVIATLYSLFLVPTYIVAAKNLNAARSAYGSQDYDKALQLYREVLETIPSSSAARIGAAETIFVNGKDDDALGLTLLKGVKLGKYEWERISKVMPTEYQWLFEKTKK